MVDRTFSYLCLMLPYYEKRLSQKIWNCHCFQILNINIFFDDHRQHHYRRHHHHYRCHHHHHHQGIAWQQTLLPRMPEAIFAVDWHHSAGFRSIFHQICKYVTKLICIETLSLVHYWLLSCLVIHKSNTTFQDCFMFVNKRAFEKALLQFRVVFLYPFSCWSTYEATWPHTLSRIFHFSSMKALSNVQQSWSRNWLHQYCFSRSNMRVFGRISLQTIAS